MRRTVRFLIAGTSPRRVSLLRVSRGVVSHSSVTLLTGAHLHRMTLHAMGRWARKRKRPRSGRVRGTCQKSAGTLTVPPAAAPAFNPTSVPVRKRENLVMTDRRSRARAARHRSRRSRRKREGTASNPTKMLTAALSIFGAPTQAGADWATRAGARAARRGANSGTPNVLRNVYRILSVRIISHDLTSQTQVARAMWHVRFQYVRPVSRAVNERETRSRAEISALEREVAPAPAESRRCEGRRDRMTSHLDPTHASSELHAARARRARRGSGVADGSRRWRELHGLVKARDRARRVNGCGRGRRGRAQLACPCEEDFWRRRRVHVDAAAAPTGG